MHNIDLYPDRPLGLPVVVWLVVFTYLKVAEESAPLEREWANVTVSAGAALTTLDVRRIENSVEQYHGAVPNTVTVTNIVLLGVQR